MWNTIEVNLVVSWLVDGTGTEVPEKEIFILAFISQSQIRAHHSCLHVRLVSWYRIPSWITEHRIQKDSLEFRCRSNRFVHVSGIKHLKSFATGSGERCSRILLFFKRHYTISLFFYSGNCPSCLMNLVSLRLVGVVRAGIDTSTFDS